MTRLRPYAALVLGVPGLGVPGLGVPVDFRRLAPPIARPPTRRSPATIILNGVMEVGSN